MKTPSTKQLIKENEKLRAELLEANEMLSSIQNGEIDSLVINTENGPRIFTLKGSETTYRILVETMNESAATLSVDYTILYANLSLSNLLNIPLNKLIGSKFNNYISRDNTKIFLNELNNAKHSPTKIEVKMLNSGHNEIPVYISLSHYEIDGIITIGVIITDLSKQKTMEQLKQSERDLRIAYNYMENFFNCANAPMICWDTDFKITKFNRAFEHFVDRKSIEIIGKNFSLLFPEGSREESLEKIRRTLGGEYWETVEIPILRRDGSVRIALWNSANIYADDGKTLLATIAQGLDITERKIAEEILKKDNDTFEKLVEKKTGEIIKIQYKLKRAQRLSDIGALASTVAHELRNPLAAIGMAIYNIKKKADTSKLNSHISNIEKKIAESDQIINNLLFFSRIKILRSEKLNFYNILNECIISVKDRFCQNKMKTEVILTNQELIKKLFIEADPLQMRELFNNILNNAFDATANTNGSVIIKCELLKNYIRIYFQDNGIGINQYDCKKIFEPFFTTKSKGTGLGLSVCYQIVQNHAGTIKIKSKPREGTTVTVTLPLKKHGN